MLRRLLSAWLLVWQRHLASHLANVSYVDFSATGCNNYGR